MENINLNDWNRLNSKDFKAQTRQEVQYIRQVPNKDVEFKVMMLEDEIKRERCTELETDDCWSMYDGQYPRLGPIIFTNREDTSDRIKLTKI